jgi:hypothetical protein
MESISQEELGIRVFIVFDILNMDYSPAKGHLPEHNNLAVLTVHFNRKEYMLVLPSQG